MHPNVTGSRLTCIVAITAALLFTVGGIPARAFAPASSADGLAIPLPSRTPTLAPAATAAPEEAWQALENATGTEWGGSWDVTAGRADLLIPAGFTLLPAPAAGSDVDPAARAFLAAHRDLLGADPRDLSALAVDFHGGVWWVIYRQTLGGLPVEGARLDVRLDRQGRLLFVRDQTVAGLSLPAAGIGAAEAESRAAAAMAAAGVTVTGIAPAVAGYEDLGPTREVIVPVYDPATGAATAHRAFRVRQTVSGGAARYRSYVDARSGEILGRVNEIMFDAATGTIQGDEHPATPTDPYTRVGFDDERLTVPGIGDTYTDQTGAWSIDFPDGNPRSAHAGLNGLYAHTYRQDGPDAVLNGVAQPGVPWNLVFDDSNSHPAERDVYHHMNVAHDYIKQIESGFTGVDYEMAGNVNLNQTCNAYWDGVSVNFFLEGGGCANTGEIADVIYHEYGHGITQFAYQPVTPDGGMNEGFSDYYAATITDQPLIGRGFTGPGTYLRTCDNDRRWPAPECQGEVHCMGEIMSGCCWHMRQNLISSIGDHDAAVALSDHLYHFAKYGRSTTFEGYYYDLLAVDDDNGTLADGTPHGIPIVQAFYRHNVGPGFVLDIIHTPLHDTDRTDHPYPVVAVFSSFVPLDPDSLAMIYSTQPLLGGPVSGPFRVPMTPTGAIREYAANIPAQPINTRVRYYIRGATSEMDLHATDPAGAPANQHQFLVANDFTPPRITSEPKTERSRHVWPVPVVATVTDNQSVASVTLEYKINGVDRAPVALNAAAGDSVYKGMFGGSVAVGDQVQYRIKATDSARNPNVAYLPATGYFSFPIVRDVVDDMEHGVQEWTHTNGTQGFVDQWHLETHRNHTAGGSTSWKFGGAGGGAYSNSSDGVLQMLPVALGPGASLSFWHWIHAEDQGGGQAWDGGLVEISTDDGASWGPLQPIGGYDYQIIANPASPFPPGYPVWSGSFDWRQAQFDLSAYAGQKIRLRWRFGSDGAVSYEGWYIDDVDLITTTDETAGVVTGDGMAPLVTAILGATPNPFRPRTSIAYAVAAGAGEVRLTIHDVSGRVVRTLASGVMAPGRHEAVWDGTDDAGRRLASGVYLAWIRARGVRQAEKLLLLR